MFQPQLYNISVYNNSVYRDSSFILPAALLNQLGADVTKVSLQGQIRLQPSSSGAPLLTFSSAVNPDPVNSDSVTGIGAPNQAGGFEVFWALADVQSIMPGTYYYDLLVKVPSDLTTIRDDVYNIYSGTVTILQGVTVPNFAAPAPAGGSTDLTQAGNASQTAL